MKFLVLALFVATAFAAPTPLDEENVEPVELIVNGVPEGTPLELGDIVDIKLKEHVDGQLASSTNLLHPLTAVGIAEAAAAAEADQPDFQLLPEAILLPEAVLPEIDVPIMPAPIVLPEPSIPEVAPAPIVLPEPATPEINPSPIVLPEPATPEIAPSPIVLPEPSQPEIIPTPVIPTPVFPVPEAPEIPEPVPQPAPQVPNGEVFNNGLVQVQVNGPEDAGVFGTLQNWLSLVINYISSGIQTSQQII